MGKVLISPNLMTDIADSVRNAIGTTDKLTPAELAERLRSMSGGVSLDVLASGYSSAKTYTMGDLVTYQDALYVCTADISTPEIFDDSHWSTTTVAEELSTILKAGAEELSAILKAGVADDKYY